MHSCHWGFSIVTNSIYLVLDMENDLVHVDGPNGKQRFCKITSSKDVAFE